MKQFQLYNIGDNKKREEEQTYMPIYKKNNNLRHLVESHKAAENFYMQKKKSGQISKHSYDTNASF